MTNEALARQLGLAPRALAEYVAKGAPTNSPRVFLKWFLQHHESRHAPPEAKAA